MQFFLLSCGVSVGNNRRGRLRPVPISSAHLFVQSFLATEWTFFENEWRIIGHSLCRICSSCWPGCFPARMLSENAAPVCRVELISPSESDGEESWRRCWQVQVVKSESGDVVPELQISVTVVQTSDLGTHYSGSIWRSTVKFLPDRDPSNFVSLSRSISTLPMASEIHSAAFGSASS